jgi:hypothetical protein
LTISRNNRFATVAVGRGGCPQPAGALSCPKRPAEDSGFHLAAAFSQRGAILLEVVLALLLFVAAVAVVSSALHSSMASLDRQRFGVQAANLAATVHSELDLGLRTTESLGPEPFEKPFDQWTWQLIPAAQDDQTTGAASGMSAIEVVIRNTNSAGAYRLAQTHKIVKTVVTNTPSATAVGTEGAP